MAQRPDLAEDNYHRRRVSPDGSLILHLEIDWDPRDIHQSADQWRPRLYDAATGALLLDLWGINRDARFEWTDAGITLWLSHPHVTMTNRVIVRRAGAGWEAEVDGAGPVPIAAANAELRRLPDPAYAGREDHHPGPQVHRDLSWTDWLGLLALGAAAFWLLWAWFDGDAPPGRSGFTRTAGGARRISAWLVRCPEPIGLGTLSIGTDDRLRVPPDLAPEPLPPLGELSGKVRRWGDASVTVTTEGTHATIVKDGQTLACGTHY